MRAVAGPGGLPSLPHRVEDAIRTGKNTGLDHLPSVSFETNQAWCLAAGMAGDLVACLRLCLPAT